MSEPHEQGNPATPDLGLEFWVPQHDTSLIDPVSAPRRFLEQVRVAPDGQSLVAVTDCGPVWAELYWHQGQSEEVQQASFQPAVHPNPAPDVATGLTQRYPFALIPPGVNYGIVVRAPLEVAAGEWSDPRQVVLAKLVTLQTIEDSFPGVIEANGRDHTLYDLSATEKTRPALAATVRVDGGEPLVRCQTIGEAGGAHYQEKPFGFSPSPRRPDTAIGAIDARYTVYQAPKGTQEQPTDSQELVFEVLDGSPSTAKDGLSGLVEIIVFRTTEVELSDLVLEPSFKVDLLGLQRREEESPRLLSFGGLKGQTRGASSTGRTGETRFRAPKRIKTSSQGIRDRVPLTAFRFVLRGE